MGRVASQAPTGTSDVITADDVGRIPLFAALSENERERVCRVAADITLMAGEYAAHEGDDRALFALLEGRIQAVKQTDGIERVVGQRHQGEIFGESRSCSGRCFPSASVPRIHRG
jgi:thioredoxin reductase (NADPH)